MIGLRISGADDLAAVSRDLRKYGERGKLIRKELTKELRAIGKPAVPAARRAARSIPSKSHGTLRADIARSVQLSVKTSGRNAQITVRINPRRMPSGKKNLPGYMEGEPPFSRWRHPVYGTGKYVTQRPHPFFYSAMRPFQRRAQLAAGAVIDRIAKDLEH